MRIQLLSDLHLEFYPDQGKAFVQSLDASGVDVLVLAGDISLVNRGWLARAVGWFCQKWPEVVFVLGNHEFYNYSVDGTLDALAALAKEHPNFHWLENSSVEIGGQRFVGSTLWFPNLPDGQNARFARGLNDFHLIHDFPQWVYGRNAESLEFLSREVREGDVVVTHHIPAIEGVHPRWLHDVQGFGRFFLCQMPAEVLRRPKLWLYGHTHDTMKFQLGDCRFFCNPFGYYGREENWTFERSLVLEV